MSALNAAVGWAHLVACVGLVGGCALLLIAGRSDRPTARAWEARVLRSARILAVLALVSALLVLGAQTALAAGRTAAAFEPRVVARMLLETHGGFVWLVREGFLLLLAAFLAVRLRVETRLDWRAARGEAALLGIVALGLLGAAGHAAAVKPGAALAVTVDAIHIAATGVWVGGLWPLAALLASASRESGSDARPYAVVTARRFSRWALGSVLVLVATGSVSTAIEVGDIPRLVGTRYGHLLLLKLALVAPILVLASVNRSRLLPALGGDGDTVGRPAMRRLGRFVSLEAVLALLVLAVAATLSVTPPGEHEQPAWPFPLRLSLTALDGGTLARTRVLIGSQLALLGAVGIASALLLHARRRALLVGAVVLAAGGFGIALPPFVVDAYPTTYVRPAVPYAAASVARGATLYRDTCATCHGPTGAGDGPAARGLSSPPADFRAGHTRAHTAGDLFWWITHGVAGTSMPAFAGRLAEPERWDLVNFVRTLAAAEAARRLGPAVEPERPWLVAPDFTFAVGPTPARALRDYRGRRMVLLVLYTLPASRARLAQLAAGYEGLAVLGVEVVAVPTDAAADAIRRLGAEPRIFFPVVTDGAREILDAYRLFAPGPHAELLIDRAGYVRAILRDLGPRPPDLNTLLAEVQELNQEKTVARPPDEHVH